LPALSWKATKPAGRAPGKREQASAYAFQRRENQSGDINRIFQGAQERNPVNPVLLEYCNERSDE